jgi:hypothetical protein
MNRAVIAVVSTAAFGGLCWDSATRLADQYPSIWMCLDEPAKYAGKPVWIAPNRVLSSGTYSFVVDCYDERIKVHSLMQPPVGSTVMVFGTFQVDGSVMAIKAREDSAYRWKRRAVYGISLLVLVVAAWVFHRMFAWRDGALHPR